MEDYIRTTRHHLTEFRGDLLSRKYVLENLCYNAQIDKLKAGVTEDNFHCIILFLTQIDDNDHGEMSVENYLIGKYSSTNTSIKTVFQRIPGETL